MPEFALDREHREREKVERLAPAVERALARREPAREAPRGLRDRRAGRAGAGRARRAARAACAAGWRSWARRRAARCSAAARRRWRGWCAAPATPSSSAASAATSPSGRSSPAWRGSSSPSSPSASRATSPTSWPTTTTASRPRAGRSACATARRRPSPGVDGSPAVTFKLSVPDFARLLAEEVEPQELLFSGRFDVEGDLTLATRVPEMFGAPPQF